MQRGGRIGKQDHIIITRLRAIHVSGPNENRPRDAVVRDSPPPRILWLVRSDEYPQVVFTPGPAAAWRAYRRAASADITKAWRVTAWSRCPARGSGGGHARVPGGALRLAAHRRPRRRATALLHLLLGELRRREHDPGDHLVRPGQLLRRQSEGHLSLALSPCGRSPGGGSSGGAWRASRVDTAARIALRPAPRGTLRDT